MKTQTIFGPVSALRIAPSAFYWDDQGRGSLPLTSFFTCMHCSVISSTLQVDFLQISGVLYAALSSLVSCPANSSCLSSFIPAPSQVSIITRLYLILPLGAASQKLSSRNKLGQSQDHLGCFPSLRHQCSASTDKPIPITPSQLEV